MRTHLVWILLFSAVLSGGAFLRLWQLEDRPMHTDESVHAEKFGTLLNSGWYRYDPDEFHGPTLNYLTLGSAWLRGEQSYVQTDKTTMRLVPAAIGTLLILTPLLFVRFLGLRAVFFSSVLLAFSPAFVYYSRYYIQEMLLVFFAAMFLGALWNYFCMRRLIWIIFAGIFVGLMHATKETFVFTLAAIAAAAAVAVFRRDVVFRVTPSHLFAALISMGAVSFLFFSSFGDHPQGMIDSVLTYGIWMQRAGGQSVHIHPWYFYLDLITWIELFEPLVWNEDGIVALALIGAVWAFTGKTSRRFRAARYGAVFTVALTVIYSAIPYKTPWCLLNFLFGMALLAGFAADRLLAAAGRRWMTAIVTGVLVLYGFLSPLAQSWMLNFRYAADPDNPYVYAHTSEDIYDMVERVRAAALASDQGTSVKIQVIAAGDDYWPFPWYLRDFSNVGYWNTVKPAVCSAPIIVASARHEEDLLNTLFTVPPPGQRQLYMPLFDEMRYLRPGVEWRGYVRKDLWERMQKQTQTDSPQTTAKDTFMEVNSDKSRIENLLKFSHQAMNSNFEIYIQHDQGTYAGRAARAAFNEVDRLERLLSRYIENSDVTRINVAAPGQGVIVDDDTMQCLLIARQAYDLSGGAFDVTIGRLVKGWKTAGQEIPEMPGPVDPQLYGMRYIDLEPEQWTVKRGNAEVEIDLGGIGKGYAVDVMAGTLRQWGIEKALIHGGTSSVLAMQPPDGKPGWPVVLSDPRDESTMMRLHLSNEALSSSGIQHGSHIVNPQTGRPVEDRKICWVRTAQTAALGDALSTAAMIVPLEMLRDLRDKTCISVLLLVESDHGTANWFQTGDWPACD